MSGLAPLFSARERAAIRQRFTVFAPHVLLAEIAADLVKPSVASDGKSQAGGVQATRALAQIFEPHQLVVPKFHFLLTIREFESARRRQPPPIRLGPTVETVSDGLQLTALSEAVKRMQSASPDDIDFLAANEWRGMAQCGVESYSALLRERNIELPATRNASDALRMAQELLGQQNTSTVWLTLFLQHCGSEHLYRELDNILHGLEVRPLSEWAPYTHFCLTTLLAGIMCWRDRHVPQTPNNGLDLQYLYYLPFCSIFCSADRLHRTLGQLLIRSDQRFASPVQLSTDFQLVPSM